MSPPSIAYSMDVPMCCLDRPWIIARKHEGGSSMKGPSTWQGDPVPGFGTITWWWLTDLPTRRADRKADDVDNDAMVTRGRIISDDRRVPTPEVFHSWSHTNRVSIDGDDEVWSSGELQAQPVMCRPFAARSAFSFWLKDRFKLLDPRNLGLGGILRVCHTCISPKDMNKSSSRDFNLGPSSLLVCTYLNHYLSSWWVHYVFLLVDGRLTASFLQSYERERDDAKKSVVSVSSTFSPGSHKGIPDTIFRSSDAVLFYVNSATLLRVTKRAFEPILKSSLEEKSLRNKIINIPDNSPILDAILHVFYDISLFRPSPPSLDVLEAAVSRMDMYALAPPSYITPSTPYFEALYSHAQLGPHIAVRVYALAGQYSLHSLAIQTSPLLLSYTLSDLSDDLAKRMGAKYLRRLMSLHLTRVDELKRIIIFPPYAHPPMSGCSLTDQKSLARAWALAASYLAWDTRPGE